MCVRVVECMCVCHVRACVMCVRCVCVCVMCACAMGVCHVLCACARGSGAVVVVVCVRACVRVCVCVCVCAILPLLVVLDGETLLITGGQFLYAHSTKMQDLLDMLSSISS